jgi:hypothetical protein
MGVQKRFSRHIVRFLAFWRFGLVEVPEVCGGEAGRARIRGVGAC